ncbi:MAG TPA: hypothetical protein VFN48_04960 [Solirubrobacteraceae bacterium]|nr:hypothetical protein [Solirubrobacteraceae bacterium]
MAGSRAARLHGPELSVGLRLGGAVALVVFMFATSWYGVSTPARGPFGTATATVAGAWSMLQLLRWVLLLTAAAALLSLGVRGRAAVDAARLLSGVATVGLFLRLLVVPPDPHAVLDVKVGGYLALIACAALCLGAWEAETASAGAVGARGRTGRPVRAFR